MFFVSLLRPRDGMRESYIPDPMEKGMGLQSKIDLPTEKRLPAWELRFLVLVVDGVWYHGGSTKQPGSSVSCRAYT